MLLLWYLLYFDDTYSRDIKHPIIHLNATCFLLIFFVIYICHVDIVYDHCYRRLYTSKVLQPLWWLR